MTLATWNRNHSCVVEMTQGHDLYLGKWCSLHQEQVPPVALDSFLSLGLRVTTSWKPPLSPSSPVLDPTLVPKDLYHPDFLTTLFNGLTHYIDFGLAHLEV